MKQMKYIKYKSRLISLELVIAGPTMNTFQHDVNHDEILQQYLVVLKLLINKDELRR